MEDPYGKYLGGISSPARQHYEIVPNDSEDLPVRTRAIYVNGAGNAALVADGVEITYSGLVAGTILPLRVDRVLDAGTTADLIAWY
jgi:hypothetical protein